MLRAGSSFLAGLTSIACSPEDSEKLDMYESWIKYVCCLGWLLVVLVKLDLYFGLKLCLFGTSRLRNVVLLVLRISTLISQNLRV